VLHVLLGDDGLDLETLLDPETAAPTACVATAVPKPMTATHKVARMVVDDLADRAAELIRAPGGHLRCVVAIEGYGR
jgi:hypothetical protein